MVALATAAATAVATATVKVNLSVMVMAIVIPGPSMLNHLACLPHPAPPLTGVAGRGRCNFSECRSSAEIGPLPCRHRAEADSGRASSGRTRAGSGPGSGRSRSSAGESRGNFGRRRPKLYRRWPPNSIVIGRIRPSLARAQQILTNSGQISSDSGPTSTNLFQQLGSFGPGLAKMDQFRPDLGRCGADPEQIRQTLGRS